MEIIRYLHLNPVRAGMVSDPRGYRWSSHEAYVRGKTTNGIAVEEGLKLWGGQRGQAINAYQQFIRDGLGSGHQEEYYEVKDQRYLGDDNFVEAVCRKVDEQEPAGPVKITMEEILTEIAKEAGKAVKVLLGKGRGRVESRLRAEAGYVGREVGGISLTVAAKYLGRDLSTMSLALKRLEEELAADSVRRMQMERLCIRLRQGRRRKYQSNKA
jgi:putative transposase